MESSNIIATTGAIDNSVCVDDTLLSKFFETFNGSLGSCAVSNVSQEVLLDSQNLELFYFNLMLFEFRLNLIFYQCYYFIYRGYPKLSYWIFTAFLFEGFPIYVYFIVSYLLYFIKIGIITIYEDIIRNLKSRKKKFHAESQFKVYDLTEVISGDNTWRKYANHNPNYTMFHWSVYFDKITGRYISWANYRQRLLLLEDIKLSVYRREARKLLRQLAVPLGFDIVSNIGPLIGMEFRAESWFKTDSVESYAYFCEQAYLVIHLLKKIVENNDRATNLALLTRVISGQSITQIFSKAYNSREALFTYFMDKFKIEDVPEKFKAESFLDVVSEINSRAGDAMKLLECEFYQKLLNLGSLLLCIPVLNKMGITPELLGIDQASEEIMRRDYSRQLKIALPAIIMENCTYVILKLSQVQTCGLSALYVSSKDHEEFENLYIWLRQRADNLARCSEVVDACGKPDPYTLEGYLNKCSQALHLADKIIPSTKKIFYLHKMLTEQKLSIYKYQSNCMAEMKANETRPQPYAVVLVGPPDIGKTTIGHALAQQMHQIDNAAGRFEIEFSAERIYNYEPGQDFYSGFRTDHSVIMLDDVSQKRPDIMKAQEGGDLRDFISIINSQPFTPNQAELHKKGTIPMRARYVIANTNVPDLSAQFIFSCPGAVYRRAVFIECEPKSEYTHDGIALRNDDPTNMDLWNFKIKRAFTTKSNFNWKYWDKSINRFTGTADSVCNIKDLMKFLTIDMKHHWEKTSTAKESLAYLAKSDKCSECGLSSQFCSGHGLSFKAESFMDPTFTYNATFGVMYLFGYFYILFCVVIMYPMLYLVHTTFERLTPTNVAKTVGRGIMNFVMFSTPNRDRLSDMRDWVRLNFPSVAYIFDAWYWWTLFETVKYKSKRAAGRFQDFCTNVNNLPIVLVFLGMLAAGIKYYSVHDSFSAEVQFPMMPEPDEAEKEKKNWWSRENAMGSFPSRGRTIQTYTLTNQCKLNTVKLIAYFGGKSYGKTNAFLIKGNLLVTVGHFFKKPIVNLTVVRLCKSPLNDGAPQYVEFKCKVDETVIHHMSEHDLTFIRIPRLLPARDLSKYFPSNLEDIEINSVGDMVVFPPDSNEHISISLKRVHKIKDIISYACEGRAIPANGCYYGKIPSSKTGEGFCGAPVMCEQGIDRMILGIHAASHRGIMTIVRPIYQEYIEEAERHLNTMVVLSDNDDDVCFSANSQAMEIVEVNKKCPTKDIHGEYVIIGGNTLPRSKPRSFVERTPMCEDILEHFNMIEPEYVSPRECSPTRAIKLAMDKVVENASFSPHEIMFAIEAMSTEFINKMTSEQFERLHTYPLSVAINGCDGIPYIDRLSMKTSGGFGHPGMKKKLFCLGNPTPYHQVCYDMTPELLEEVSYIWDQYNNGKEANPVFKCCFKDEPISPDKAKIDKVRIFSGSPTAFSIVVRQKLLCIIREFVSWRRLNFEMAIGANATGADWEEIFHHVKKFGEKRCFAGDYKAFDKQMPPEIILAAFEVIINILRKAGWDDEDIMVVRGIATDTAFPTTDLFGTLVELVGSNPSGHVLTTPINSLVNSLYMRIACRRILTKNGFKVGLDDACDVNFTKFGEEVMSLVTYGDDNCGSIHPRFNCINHTSIQEALGEVGIVYTMDVKNAESVEYVSVYDISFLKRKFRVDNDLGRVVAPLLEQSIIKSLTIWTRSREITKQCQMAEIIQSACREYFNYGKKKFEKERKFLDTIVNKYDLRVWLNDGLLPTYDEIKSQCGFI